MWNDRRPSLECDAEVAMASLLVNIDVDDIDAACRFYTAAFGLRLGRRLGSDFVELVGAEVPIYLLANRAGSPPFPEASEARSYARHWSPLHLDLVVPDIAAAIARAVEAGAKLEGSVRQ